LGQFEDSEMTFLARLLRYLFWVMVAWWTVSLLRRLVGHMGASQTQREPDIDMPGDSFSQKLVRDPVCGMHLAPSLALAVKQGGEMLHFCSPQCRDKYLGNTQKFVANA
jgi:YHS domain-containing protein